jgi:hypothetical protein
LADPATERATAQVIASRLRLAANYLRDARTLKASNSRTSSFCLFMAAETALLAVLASEGIPGAFRGGQHQLGVMADSLPDVNPTKRAFRTIEGLAAYATTFRYTTPSGRIPSAMSDKDFTSHSATVEHLIGVCAQWFRVTNLDIEAVEPAGNIAPIRVAATSDEPPGSA